MTGADIIIALESALTSCVENIDDVRRDLQSERKKYYPHTDALRPVPIPQAVMLRECLSDARAISHTINVLNEYM